MSPPRYLPYGRHDVDEADVEAVARVLRGDWLTTGPAVAAFEEALAASTGARHAVACSSATAGLHLAMLALGVKPGDVVVVPSLTFVATANAVRYAGGDVVFADVDPDSGLMQPAHLAAALAQASQLGRIAAAIPVHLNGQCGDLEGLASVARDAGAALVEDACHAIGGSYAAERLPVGCCRHSEMAVFSFHPVKAVAMGEGGAVTTNQDALARRLSLLRSHGLERDAERFENPDAGRAEDGSANPWYYELGELGYNYRASDVHCALGLSQLRRLDAFVRRRAELVARYEERLAPLAPALHPIARSPLGVPAWHLCAVLIDFEGLGIQRAAVMRRLRQHGVGSQVHYVPVHRQPYYRRLYGDLALPGADAYYRRALSLPLFVGMQGDDVDRVVDALAQALRA